MSNVQFSPLPTWPGKTTVNRKNLSGEQAYPKVIERLKSELSHLSAQNIVIQTGHQPRDIRQDGWLRSDARQPSHPGVLLHFDSRLVRGGKSVGSLRFACDTYATWKDNLRAIVLTLESLRAVERYGAVQTAEQYKGFSGPPAVATPKPEASSSRATDMTGSLRAVLQEQLERYHAAARLLLKEAATAEVSNANVKSMCSDTEEDRTWARTIARQAAANAHPDKGGSDARFNAVQNARKELKL